MEGALNIVVGSTLSVELQFYDDNDVPESLAGATAATFRILTSSVNGTAILSRSTGTANLTIGSSKLTATLTQPEADALKPGCYVAEAAVQFPAGWYHTQYFRVVVLRALAPHA